eukprot:1392433-Amorphochlora_amoeboformis.AAC.1
MKILNAFSPVLVARALDMFSYSLCLRTELRSNWILFTKFDVKRFEGTSTTIWCLVDGSEVEPRFFNNSFGTRSGNTLATFLERNSLYPMRPSKSHVILVLLHRSTLVILASFTSSSLGVSSGKAFIMAFHEGS